MSPAPSDAKSSPGPSNPPPDSAKNVKVRNFSHPHSSLVYMSHALHSVDAPAALQLVVSTHISQTSFMFSVSVLCS